MIWYPDAQLHKIQSIELYTCSSQRRIHHVQDSRNRSPRLAPHSKHVLRSDHVANTLFPWWNPQPHYNLKSTRLRTPITLGLCRMMLRCTIIRDQRELALLASNFEILQRKTKKINRCQGWRLPCKHTTKRYQWTTRRPRNVKWEGKELRTQKPQSAKGFMKLKDSWSS